MKRIRLAFIALLLLTAAVAPAAEPQHTCLWRIQGPTSTVYLLGSMHMLTPDAYPLPPAIEKAFDAADTTVFEVDFGEAMTGGLELLQRGYLQDSRSLNELLPADLHQPLAAALKQVGMSTDEVQTMKPWFLAITLSNLELQRAGYDPTNGIDLRLYTRAVKDGKAVAGLETIQQQIALLDGISDGEQVELLRQTLAEMDQMVPEVRKITKMWRDGNAAGLQKLLLTTFRDAPNALERLVYARNRAWLPKVVALTRGNRNAIVVVGALHLVGDKGLVALLSQRGYHVEQE
ncbi:MAG: TraB/GumN family protein [Acidobacteria bacterium]|jgi:uncharacterized protein|nr:TraB/GumN family protein [Acidobacteriota bacterium]